MKYFVNGIKVIPPEIGCRIITKFDNKKVKLPRKLKKAVKKKFEILKKTW